MDNKFMLPCGVDMENTEGLKNAYETHPDGGFEAVVSAEKLPALITELAGLIKEPVFFFLELPDENSADDSGWTTYYLDNCTSEVISVLIKEYGSLLAGDGVCRFGFGGNESGGEIYVKLYKVISVYPADEEMLRGTLKAFGKFGMEQTSPLVTPWELISEENPAVCVRAEEDGISLFDLPEMLKNAGMYRAE
ncbi:MAG: hypothetical protein K6B74_09825 [Ruminococcus sp.]|nr:hypothetical protein [Ruminococcus sp.]